MKLDKHNIQGLAAFTSKTLPSSDFEDFEQLMLNAEYFEIGTALAQSGRIKVWWSHDSYPRVESIYSSDKNTVLTAHHIS